MLSQQENKIPLSLRRRGVRGEVRVVHGPAKKRAGFPYTLLEAGTASGRGTRGQFSPPSPKLGGGDGGGGLWNGRSSSATAIFAWAMWLAPKSCARCRRASTRSCSARCATTAC